MQKLITLTIDIGKLQEQAAGPFSITEIDAISELLQAGWIIESWEFITGDDERTKAVILMMLNDGMDGTAFEDAFYEMDEPDEDDEEFPAGDEAQNGGR